MNAGGTADRPAGRSRAGETDTRGEGLRSFVSERLNLAGLAAVIVVIAVTFQVLNPIFLSFGNIVEMLRAGALYFVVACAATLVLVSGGIDFSAGALYAAGGVVAGLLMTAGAPWPLAVIVGILIGAVLGLVNGAVTVYLKVPPLIATLGMFFAAGGIVILATKGNPVYGFPASFTRLGQGSVLGIPYLVYYAAISGILFWVLMAKTPLGYNARAVGGSRGSASANGIRIARHDLIVYAVSGGMAALGGILLAARLSSANPAAGGADLTFQVVTAVIVGGTSLFGGIGGIGGSALGVLLFAEVNNGLVVINVDPLAQNIFVGVILVTAVAIDQARRSRQFTRRKAR